MKKKPLHSKLIVTLIKRCFATRLLREFIICDSSVTVSFNSKHVALKGKCTYRPYSLSAASYLQLYCRNSVGIFVIYLLILFVLSEYMRQIEVIDWILGLRQRKFNGILADKMGSGKNTTVVTLFTYMK